MIIFLLFILGLIVGSFLNVVIFRLHSGKTFLTGRSECTHCHHTLSHLDLIPLLSFVFLSGKCRYCKKKISWQYPVVELITGIVFALLAQQHLESRIMNYELWFQLVFAGFLIVIAVYDFKHYLILDKVVFPATVLAIVSNIVLDLVNKQNLISWNSHLVSGLLGAVIISGFFLFQYSVSRGKWIGFGDVKLGLFLGSAAGWPLILLVLFVAYYSGAIFGLVLMAMGKKQLSSKLPFGTFLSLSAIIVMIFSNVIMGWYSKLLGL